MRSVSAWFNRLFSSLRVSTNKREETSSIQSANDKAIELFAETLGKAKRVVVMCGAGLSVNAGIPDFRSPGTGLYSQLEKYSLPYPEAIFEINYFQQKPEAFIQLAKELWPGGKYQPTLGHHFIKLLHDKGVLLRCYTQNIDSLETAAGIPKEKLVAAHGNFDGATCVITGKDVPIDEARTAYLTGDFATLNAKYDTKLVKPNIVFFGEELPERFFTLRKSDLPQCDAVLVMGTSLQVHPFASLVDDVPLGVPRMLINKERVGAFAYHTGDTDFHYAGDCDDGCLSLAKKLGWEADLKQLYANSHITASL